MTEEYRRRGVTVLTEALVAKVEPRRRADGHHAQGRALADGRCRRRRARDRAERRARRERRPDGRRRDRRRRIRTRRRGGGRLRDRRRRALPVSGARQERSGRARGSREHARAGGGGERRRRERGRTTTCRSSTPISSSSATRRSARPTRGSGASRRGAPTRSARAGSAFLDDSDRPRGILLWGIFGKMDAARELIRAGQPLSVDGLRELVG